MITHARSAKLNTWVFSPLPSCFFFIEGRDEGRNTYTCGCSHTHTRTGRWCFFWSTGRNRRSQAISRKCHFRGSTIPESNNTKSSFNKGSAAIYRSYVLLYHPPLQRNRPLSVRAPNNLSDIALYHGPFFYVPRSSNVLSPFTPYSIFPLSLVFLNRLFVVFFFLFFLFSNTNATLARFTDKQNLYPFANLWDISQTTDYLSFFYTDCCYRLNCNSARSYLLNASVSVYILYYWSILVLFSSFFLFVDCTCTWG